MHNSSEEEEEKLSRQDQKKTHFMHDLFSFCFEIKKKKKKTILERSF